MAIVKKIKEPTAAAKVAAGHAGATPEDPIDALIIGAGPSGRTYDLHLKVCFLDINTFIRNGLFAESSKRSTASLRHYSRTPISPWWHLDRSYPGVLDAAGSRLRI